jgi:hypothetical protein
MLRLGFFAISVAFKTSPPLLAKKSPTEIESLLVLFVIWDAAATLHVLSFSVLPPHTSHILQPMDVWCFSPFETLYQQEVHKFMCQSVGRSVTRYDICESLLVLFVIWDAAATLHVLSFSIDFPVYTREGMVLEVSITNGFNGCMPVLLNEDNRRFINLCVKVLDVL